MEAEKMTSMDSARKDDDDDDEDVALPGFRFHPTDEELVGFYLRRKVEKKPLSIELIKQVDIYKYDPWDLPIAVASNVGDKEWYFFCKRGRKYRNSIRPNRVTGSGFWKATGIDRPIYSDTSGEGRGECIGLKKSLVYYRGSAGKGTKTDWMMHEFRLPADHDDKSTKHTDVKSIARPEAEVWTLCRILKRNASYRKCIPDWRELSAKRNNLSVNASSKTCNVEYSDSHESYISFKAPQNDDHRQKKKQFVNNNNVIDEPNYQMLVGQFGSISDHHQADPSTASSNSTTLLINPHDHKDDQYVKYGDDWDELRSVVESATNPFLV